MELKEMIKIMQHYENGGEVECAEYEYYEWTAASHPCWDWCSYNYRIKEPKAKVTIEKWLCRSEYGDFVIKESTNVDKFTMYEKVKLIESYEVEL